jgi:hypothetical protein
LNTSRSLYIGAWAFSVVTLFMLGASFGIGVSDLFMTRWFDAGMNLGWDLVMLSGIGLFVMGVIQDSKAEQEVYHSPEYDEVPKG